jgi:hypothetical protein
MAISGQVMAQTVQPLQSPVLLKQTGWYPFVLNSEDIESNFLVQA